MREDTEKALLEFARATADLMARGVGCMEKESREVGRAYLFTLEPKPEPGNPLHLRPHYVQPGARCRCEYCRNFEENVATKPEPKRGVEWTLAETLRWFGMPAKVRRRVEEALRLYREERERVAGELRHWVGRLDQCILDSHPVSRTELRAYAGQMQALAETMERCDG